MKIVMKHFVYSLITLLQIGFLCNAQVGFNKVGYVVNIPNNSLFYNSVALQPDGKIVAVGGTDRNDFNGLIARFLPNGVLDAESNWNLQNFRESNNINKVSIGLLG
jgi:hypothetical protein